MKHFRLLVLPLLMLALLVTAMASVRDRPDITRAANGTAALLTDPMLQLPTADAVRVVWYTEFVGQEHTLTYGANLDQTATATTTKMSRMYEDANSERADQTYTAVTERDIWRHEAVATGLTQNVRVPYFVTSVNDEGAAITSETFSLQPAPTADHGLKILLTSDQQNRQMSPANFQKVQETVGMVDAVLFAGDLVDNPHRASEWFDRYNPAWLGFEPDPDRPDYPATRPAFFPALQGNYQELFPEFPYTGGEILQHAPLFGSIGNHESPGRWRPNETFILNGQEVTATINFMDNDPQPHWYAEIRYEQQKDSINPTDDPAIKEQWIRENSFEHTQYFEMWNHPADGPAGESYYAYQIGDLFVISMNVSRVWRTWNITPNDRGKFTEIQSELSNPDNWGFGDMWFETYAEGSEQYAWLNDVLESEAFQNAKYKVVLAHQTMFGLGDNAVPVMADRVMTIVYEQGGQEQTLEKTLPLDQATWEAEIEPILNSITEIRYEYPLDQDVWRNDIEPLLLQYDVDLVHVGHSHLWNRAQVGALHYIETSNVGNSFGAYYADEEGVYAERTRWAGSFWDELAAPDSRWNPENYPSTNDPHDRAPAFPTIFNPMRELEGTERDLPFLSSNSITAFSILDTATGTVSSYAFDTRDPDSPVRKFDEFSLSESPFRVEPYLQNPAADGITITWFTEDELAGTLTISGGGLAEPRTLTSTPELREELTYSELELSEIGDFPDMFANRNYKHSLRVSDLMPGTTYDYAVTVGDTTIESTFTTAPTADTDEPIRFIVFADAETDPVGRTNKRDWGNSAEAPAAQAPDSTGRPADLPQDSSGRDLYLATEQAGYANNLAIVKERAPDFLLMAGDLVQGGGYQRAWDEFFYHNAGKFDNPLSHFPLLPALGNWENFGARNGGYAPEAVFAARQKYKAYFDAPPNNNPDYQDQYYRIDYGPVTIITLDSSNGLPDGERASREGLPPSDNDTQENVRVDTYPGDDLADFNPGSDQWNWAEEQLQDARAQGQIIFVQFHHVPYSSGVHGFPMSSPNSSGQGGTPMRVYAPLFEQYGVVAVFSGHSEFFERSLVNGVHYYDVGVAGDGLRGPVAPELAAESNPFSQWTAHYDEPELWQGNRLISGGKHYGHVEVNIVPAGSGGFDITLTPVHAFPVINDMFEVTAWERRAYNDEIQIRVPAAADDPNRLYLPLIARN
ncbi:MAG: metallophosphoesterase [Chloroflexaceae bacterium]